MKEINELAITSEKLSKRNQRLPEGYITHYQVGLANYIETFIANHHIREGFIKGLSKALEEISKEWDKIKKEI